MLVVSGTSGCIGWLSVVDSLLGCAGNSVVALVDSVVVLVITGCSDCTGCVDCQCIGLCWL